MRRWEPFRLGQVLSEKSRQKYIYTFPINVQQIISALNWLDQVVIYFHDKTGMLNTKRNPRFNFVQAQDDVGLFFSVGTFWYKKSFTDVLMKIVYCSY